MNGMKMDIGKTVRDFFERRAEELDREYNVYLEKELEGEWNKDWAIFFAVDRGDDVDEYVDMTIYHVADLLEKEFEPDKSVKIKIRENSNEIEVYRE